MRPLLPLCILYLLSSVSAAAHAGFVMIVDDPSTQQTEAQIVDGGLGDGLVQIPGLISFSGVVGGIQVDVVGESKGAVGSASMPEMIMTLSPSAGPGPGSSGGTVDILLTDTDFSTDAAKGFASIQVNGFGGFFDFSFFGDSSNREFGEGFEIASTNGSVSPGFDQTLEGPAQPVGSLTMFSRVGFTRQIQAAGFRTELTLEGAALTSWYNADNPLDVNNQDGVSPLDALLVINELTLREFSDPVTGLLILPAAPPPFYDVNNDGFAAPLDALLVINSLPSTSSAPSSALSGGDADGLAPLYESTLHVNGVAAGNAIPVPTGDTLGMAPVPEPSGAGLWLLGTLVLALQRHGARI